MDYSYQDFNHISFIIHDYYTKYYREIKSHRLFINQNNSLGISLKFNITPKIKLKIGYLQDNIRFTCSDSYYNSVLIGDALIFGFYYNLWKIREYRFFDNQFYVDAFTDARLHWYNQFEKYSFHSSKFISNDYNNEISDHSRFSYDAGFNLDYKIEFLYISFSGFINYHENLGVIELYGRGVARNIDYLLSYGFNLGVGYVFNKSIRF